MFSEWKWGYGEGREGGRDKERRWGGKRRGKEGRREGRGRKREGEGEEERGEAKRGSVVLPAKWRYLSENPVAHDFRKE